MIHGIINIYKEKGFTSHDVVAKARGILRERKIGHTGTLDPDAVGVLPICIGKATKVVPFLTDADKCYEAEVILGAYTTTEDATGELLETYPVNVTKEQVEEVIQSFIGPYIQTPPMYSAIKVNGVRLYELARKGIVIDRPSREVTIYSCDLLEWLDDTRFKIRVQCSKGTYIRTLCTDIGKTLGCGAHMGELKRTRVGTFLIEDSLTLQQLEATKEDISQCLWPIEGIFEKYPKVIVAKAFDKVTYNGNPLPFEAIQGLGEKMTKVQVHHETDGFLGIYDVEYDRERLKVDKLFITK
ncbi:MAG: tRNA pseudouridine(55) synthase TruB [Cellulosilyticaceae bacterium]